MAKKGGVLSVTEPISMAVIGDRLHVTVVSGDKRQTYALTFADTANAAYLAARLVEEHSREHRVYHLNHPQGAEA